ncbi:TPA: hypothetical protein ACH3X3_003890 [Trebouxia sp. C0006]
MVYDNHLEAVVVVAAVVRVVDLAVAAVADMALAVAETADQVDMEASGVQRGGDRGGRGDFKPKRRIDAGGKVIFD